MVRRLDPNLFASAVNEPFEIAIVSNEQTPYRLHLHRRIATECPDVRLWSVFTHEVASSPWAYEAVDEIRPVLFGRGERTSQQSNVLRSGHEWRKGGQIIRWMANRPIGAVILAGYNDAGRLRILDWCYRRGVPCFVFGDSNIRCDAAGGWKAAMKQHVLRHILARCSGALHCGRLGFEYFRRYGVPEDRLFPFPYEPDYPAIMSPDADAVRQVQEMFRFLRSKRYLLYSGRLVAVKRTDLLLQAFANIAPMRPEWNLAIVGDGPLRRELESGVVPALRNRIIWTGFIDDPERLAAVYQCCDVLTLPSDFEPWGVVVTEAAAAGLALLTSSVVGAAADVLEDGRNGRIFRTGDLSHLEECLLDITGPDLPAMKAASPGVLARWRERADPVAGLRRALTAVGLVHSPAAAGVPSQ
jgi:glycosyltransferase involved in cell wall biosynthesis